jgi:hypothetical protein
LREKTEKETKKKNSLPFRFDGNCFLLQESSADGGIRAKGTTMSRVYWETLNCIDPLGTKGVEC